MTSNEALSTIGPASTSQTPPRTSNIMDRRLGQASRTLTPSLMPLWFPRCGLSGSRAWTSQWGIGSFCPLSTPERTLGTTIAKGHSTAAVSLKGFKDTTLIFYKQKRLHRTMQGSTCQSLSPGPRRVDMSMCLAHSVAADKATWMC